MINNFDEGAPRSHLVMSPGLDGEPAGGKADDP